MSEIFGNGVMGGGGLTNSKLALANAQAADVRSGKKFYAGDKQIKTGTLADVTQATPAITVDAAGKITASATQATGVVAAGTKSATKQLTVQAGKTVTPSISAQTAVASQRFTTGDVKVAAVNGIIRVTYPAGDTCTCKNGSTTLTANASDGITVFLVPNTGTWTLTVTNGTKTATKTVSITATSRFANVTLAYFTATLNITYPAKSTCVIKNSSGAQVASDTNTGTAAKTWTATVGATGTYTITATATDGSGKTKSTTVSITTNGQVATVTLMFKLYLFTSGEGVVDDWTPLYGGYTKAAVTSEKMTLNGGEALYYSSTAAVTSNNAIDLSGYSKLVVDVQTNKAATDNVYAWVGVSATKFTRGSESTTISISNSAAYTKISTTTRDEIEVDIANINTGYVFVASNGTNINTTVYNIWLE